MTTSRATVPTPRRRRTHRRALAALVGALLLTGCAMGDTPTSGGTGGSSSGGNVGAGGGWEGEWDGAGDSANDLDRGESAPGAEPPGAGPREVIRTAELVLDVADATTAADEVTRIATSRGGYIAGADLSRDERGVVRGMLILKVPADTLDEVVDALDELAVSVPVRRVEETDVTSEVVDLRARLTNLTAYEETLRELLAEVREGTSSTEDLLQVFEQLRRVRDEIDRLQARLDSLRDRVALSTVFVTLQPARSALPVTDPTWQPSETLRSALAATTSALTTIADGAIRLVVTVLPVAVVLALPVVALLLVLRAVLRRMRRDEAEDVGPLEGPPAADA